MIALGIRSVPTQCPECGSDKLHGRTDALRFKRNDLVCYVCGAVIGLGYDGVPQEEIELVAELGKCPHCKTVGHIEVHAGSEWCLGCGLDPSAINIPAPAISHLWRKGSGISGMLQRNVNMIGAHHPLGQFVRDRCGPHCSFESFYPQEVSALITCYKANNPIVVVGNDMSKKSRKARKEAKKARKQEHKQQQEAIERAKRRATFMCAKAGWFEKVMYVDTPNPEQSGDTGS